MNKGIKFIFALSIILLLLAQNVFASGYSLNSIDDYVGKLVADLNGCYYQKNSGTSYNPYSKRYFNGGKQCVGYAVARTEEKLKMSGIPSGGSTGEAAKNIPAHYTNNKYNGKTVTSYMTNVKYTIQAYKNDGGKNLTSNCWASFNSSSIYGHVVYVEEVVNKNGTTYVYYTEGGGSLSPGVLRKKKLSDFVKLYKGYVGCVTFTPSAPSTPQHTTCTVHTYNSSGYCTKCNEEYPINVSVITPTKYYSVKNNVPVRARPYAPDKTLRSLNKDEAVTVIGSGRNSPGNIWYKLDDRNWVYSENVTKTPPASTVSTQPEVQPQPQPQPQPPEAVIPVSNTKTVTIKYNANGGSGAPPSYDVAKDSEGVANYRLSNSLPARKGHTFLGWRLENDTAYDIDSPGQSIAIQLSPTQDETLTYYAQWK